MPSEAGSLEDRYRDTRRDLLVAQRRLASAQEEVSLITDDLQKARAQRDAAERRMRELASQDRTEAEVQALRAEIARLRTQGKELEGERDVLRVENVALRGQMESMRSDVKRETAELRAQAGEERARAKKEVEALKAQLEDEKARAKEENEELKARIEGTAAEAKEGSEALKGLQEQVDALRREKDQWASRLKAKDRRISALEEEVILTISEVPVKKEEGDDATSLRTLSTSDHPELSPTTSQVPQKRPVATEDQVAGSAATNKRVRPNGSAAVERSRRSAALEPGSPTSPNTSLETAVRQPSVAHLNAGPTSLASTTVPPDQQPFNAAPHPTIPRTAITPRPPSPTIHRTNPPNASSQSNKPPTVPRVLAAALNTGQPGPSPSTSATSLSQRPLPPSHYPQNNATAVAQPAVSTDPRQRPNTASNAPSTVSSTVTPSSTAPSRPIQSNKPANATDAPTPRPTSRTEPGSSSQNNAPAAPDSPEAVYARAKDQIRQKLAEHGTIRNQVASSSGTQSSVPTPNTAPTVQAQPASQPKEITITIRESLDSRISHLRAYPLPPDSEPDLTLSRSAQKVLAQDWFVPSNCVCQSIIMSYKAGRRGLHDMMWLDPIHQPGFPTGPGKPGTLLSIIPASLVNDLGSVGLWVARGNSDWTYYGHYKVERCTRTLTVSEFQRLNEDTRKFWIDTIFQCRLFHDRERSIHSTSDVQEAKLRIEMELRRGGICIDVLALRCATFNPTLTRLLQETARRKSRRSR